jgi:hypothetical protein
MNQTAVDGFVRLSLAFDEMSDDALRTWIAVMERMGTEGTLPQLRVMVAQGALPIREHERSDMLKYLTAAEKLHGTTGAFKNTRDLCKVVLQEREFQRSRPRPPETQDVRQDCSRYMASLTEDEAARCLAMALATEKFARERSQLPEVSTFSSSLKNYALAHSLRVQFEPVIDVANRYKAKFGDFDGFNLLLHDLRTVAGSKAPVSRSGCASVLAVMFLGLLYVAYALITVQV